jgi:hypothetical protein
MGKKKKRNKPSKLWIGQEVIKPLKGNFTELENSLLELTKSPASEDEKKMYAGIFNILDLDRLNIRKHLEIPQLDFRKIISKEHPSETKIAKYMDGEIKVSKFSVGQVVKLKDYDALKLVNDSLIYHLEEYDLKRISDAQVAIYKVHNTRQLHKSGKPVFWYEVGQWGRNIVDVPEDFLEELPELVNIPSDNEEGEKQPEKPAQETEEEMVAKFGTVLNELKPYDKMAGGDYNLYPFRISNLFKACFMKDIPDSDRIEGLLHITSIARAAYQGYAKVTLSMDEISQEQLDTYRKKNADYGNAFEKSMDEDGLLVAKIRIGDKIRRIQSLIHNGGEGQVKDERLEDTYLDLANYCVMTILWIRKQQSK